MATRVKLPRPPLQVPASAPGGLPIREERLARDSKRKRPAARPDSNVLREGLRLEKVPDPHVVVLFGATGDLSHRKIFPALAQLWRTNLLPADWGLLAVGRREYDDTMFREDVAGSLHANCRIQLEPEMERQFLEQSLSMYLSPKLVKQFSRNKDISLLKPGAVPTCRTRRWR